MKLAALMLLIDLEIFDSFHFVAHSSLHSFRFDLGNEGCLLGQLVEF